VLTRPSALSWYGYCSDTRSFASDFGSNAAGGSWPSRNAYRSPSVPLQSELDRRDSSPGSGSSVNGPPSLVSIAR